MIVADVTIITCFDIGKDGILRFKLVVAMQKIDPEMQGQAPHVAYYRLLTCMHERGSFENNLSSLKNYHLGPSSLSKTRIESYIRSHARDLPRFCIREKSSIHSLSIIKGTCVTLPLRNKQYACNPSSLTILLESFRAPGGCGVGARLYDHQALDPYR